MRQLLARPLAPQVMRLTVRAMRTLLLRLARLVHCRPDFMRRRVRALARTTRTDPSALYARFQFRCDERRFAEDLLTRHTQLWLYRVDQTLACGDFVVVDMSAPNPRHRDVLAVELKLRSKLRTRGHQLRNAWRAGAMLSELGVAEGRDVHRLMGERERLLRVLSNRSQEPRSPAEAASRRLEFGGGTRGALPV